MMALESMNEVIGPLSYYHTSIFSTSQAALKLCPPFQQPKILRSGMKCELPGCMAARLLARVITSAILISWLLDLPMIHIIPRSKEHLKRLRKWILKARRTQRHNREWLVRSRSSWRWILFYSTGDKDENAYAFCFFGSSQLRILIASVQGRGISLSRKGYESDQQRETLNR